MAKTKLAGVLETEGITQAELSRKSGISQATINRLCNDKRGVSPTTQSKIVNGLNELAKNTYSVKSIFPNTKIKEEEDSVKNISPNTKTNDKED